MEFKARVVSIVRRKEDTVMTNKLYDKDNNPILYDLKNEFAEVINLVRTETNIEKWEKYKAYKVDRYSAFGIDCDVSSLALQVYVKGWRFLNGVKPTKQYVKLKLNEILPFECKNIETDKLLFTSDNILGVEKISVCLVREYKYQLILRNTTPFEYYRGDTMTSFSNTYNHYKKNFLVNEDITIEIENLAKNYHTIGNMIPVPTGFNIGRANSYAKYDFWDLTMLKIWEWYQHKEDCKGCDYCDDALEKLLLNGDSSVKYCKQWLDKFPTWKEFVDENYLNSYVDKTSYNPIIFWESHSYDKAELPTDKKDFLNYLKLLNECIENRNREILNFIKKLK